MPLRVFLFGDVASGKSTVSASVLRYLRDRRNTAILPNYANRAAAQYYYDWMNQLDSSEFPTKTPDNVFVQVAVGLLFGDSQEQFGLSFFEVSGEQVEKLIPLHKDFDSRRAEMDQALRLANCVVLIVSAQPIARAGQRLHQFVSYLVHEQKTTIPIALIITQWDKLANRAVAPAAIAASYYGDVLRLLKSLHFSSEVEVFSFSVGEVSVDAGVSKVSAFRPEDGAERIGEWLIEVFRVSCSS